MEGGPEARRPRLTWQAALDLVFGLVALVVGIVLVCQPASGGVISDPPLGTRGAVPCEPVLAAEFRTGSVPAHGL